MDSVEIAEIKRCAELISAAVIEALHADLKALHRRNAAQQMLHSGATVKESASIARSSIRSYFDRLEQFVLSWPGAQPGFDATIVDSVARSTSTVVDAVRQGLRNTANLAGDPKYFLAIEKEVEGEFSVSQETFRSNLRAHWAKRSKGPLDAAEKWVLGIELACVVALLITIGMWIGNPAGSYSPFVALFGIGFTLTEVYRRYASRQSP